jgi:hypothetical protein
MSTALQPSTRVRTLGVGVALVVCALLTTGCDQLIAEEPVPSMTPRLTTPKDELLVSAPTTYSRYSFTVTGLEGGESPTDFTGRVDAPSKAYELRTRFRDAELGLTISVSYRIIAQRFWLKVVFRSTEELIGLPELPEKWMLIDPAKVKDDITPVSFDLDSEDVAGVKYLFQAVETATKVADGRYAGTLDLNRASAASITEQKTRDALGARAKSVPFLATLDAEGRVTDVAVSVPPVGSAKSLTPKMRFREYDTAPAITAPAKSEIAETPAAAYEYLHDMYSE